MVIFGLIIINILILNIWIWMTRKLRNKRHKLWLGLTMGSVAAVSLFVYPQLLELINIAQYRTGLIAQKPSGLGIVVLIGYLLIVILCNSLITQHIKPQKQLSTQIMLFVITFIVLYMVFGWIAIPSTAIYYLLVAGSEEFLKYLSSYKLQETQGYATSDIIVFALLVALGFAFFENIVYLLQVIDLKLQWFGQLASGSTILFSRGLIAFLAHLLFTGCIALFAVSAYQKKNLTWLIAGILCSIALHLSYNLFLSHNLGFMLFVYLIGGYIFLSLLLFKSDRLYVQD